jgi:hypothetical protein
MERNDVGNTAIALKAAHGAASGAGKMLRKASATIPDIRT